MNNIMETQDNFEQYFLNTFKQTFSELLMTSCLTITKPELKTKLNKLKGLLETLDYKKIILDFSLNKNFQLWLSEYKKTDFMNDGILTKGDKKQWRIMPSFQIDEIMKCIEPDKKLIVYNTRFKNQFSNIFEPALAI